MTSPRQCIHEAFEAQAARTPERVAVVSGGGRVTFGELDARANQLAHHLRGAGVGREVRAGICLEPSPEMIIGLLAILKAGGAYVPLDPSYPQERLEFMLADSEAHVVVTTSALSRRLPAHAARTLLLDAEADAIAKESRASPVSGALPADVAYVLYTSGSTGRPKGVQGLHEGALNRFHWMWRAFPFREDEVCCQKTSLNFGDSIWEIFGPLLQGVRIVILPTALFRLVEALAAHRITRIVLVPSLLRTLLDTYADLHTRLPDLRFWVTSGEALPRELLSRFHKAMPGRTLLNLYGSSEVSADVTFYDTAQLDEDASLVPIGRPLDNSRIHLLDARFQPVPAGTVGEIHVGGVGLARGYLHRPDQTAERFIPDPFATRPGARLFRTGDLGRQLPSGDFEYLGRVDWQVKVRGVRIELGEIQSVINQHPAVRESEVLAIQDASTHELRLVACVVPRDGQGLMTEEVRTFLKQKLPKFMVPSSYLMLERMPVTPSGKVDRRALLAMCSAEEGRGRH